MSERPFRVLPAVTDATAHFWHGGGDGALRFLRCRACDTWIHPPSPTCPACLSRDLEVATSTGSGTIHSFTVNHQQWNPTMPDRYVVALVDVDEGVRVLTNIVGCDPDAVHIGQRVAVTFEEHDDVWIPLFAPEPA